MTLLAAPGVFARSPDVGSTINDPVKSSLPVVAERGEVCTGRVRAILAMMLAILPQSVDSRVHFVECPSTARIGTLFRVAAPEPAGSWSLAAAAAGPIRHPPETVAESALVPGWCPLETPAMKDDDGDGDAESRDSDASLLLGNAAQVRVKSLKVVGRQLIDGGTLRKPYLEYQLSVQLGNQVRRA